MSGNNEEIGEYVELSDNVEGKYYTSGDKESYKPPFSIKSFVKTNFKMIYFCLFCVLFICICVGILSGVIVGLIYAVKYFMILANRDYMKNRRTVIMLSVDSLRYDYFQIYPDSFKNIKEFIINNGVQLKQLKPVFPTKTFPNHYAIATGLIPVHNGLVANTMWDPEFHSLFRLSNSQVRNSSWYDGEPIWVTCEKQEVITNIFFWPGSEVEIEGYYPSVYLDYDKSLSYDKRIDFITDALKKKRSERPHLIMGYFEGVDDAAHHYGPISIQVDEAIKEVDNAIGKLWEELKKFRIDDLVDIFIVSDHGMAPLSEEKRINIDTIINMSLVEAWNFGPFVGIWPKNENDTNQILADLNANVDLKTHASINLKENIPSKYHLSTGKYSRRVAPIFILAEDEWSIVTEDYILSNGNHGYSNDDEHMQGVLIARGPHIKNNAGEMIEGFENIHIYPLLADLLEVEPASVDGSLDVSRRLLR